MLRTKNDLSEQTRTKVIELLNARLADALDLGRQVKQAHWNVRGTNFIALHKLFDEVYDDVEEYGDLLAERVAQLGGIAEGTIQAVSGRTTLGAYPLTASDSK